MRSKSLPELIDQFLSYKKANGYQYQTGAYYLKKYARFVMETAPGTVVLDKKSVEGFLEKFHDTPGSLITPPRFCVNSADTSLPVGTLMPTSSRLEGSVSQHQSSRISLPRGKLPRFSRNATGCRRCRI